MYVYVYVCIEGGASVNVYAYAYVCTLAKACNRQNDDVDSIARWSKNLPA